ncbi:MAG: glycine betaine ABC transporter substrate-binding protein [Microthrixaceae bacterium]
MFKRRRVVKLLAGLLLPLAMVAAACSSDSDDGSADSDSGGSDAKTISIAYIPWDEDIAVTYLWKQVLEDNGYKVSAEQLDVAPTFQGIADGNVDLFFDTWLPTTHADYWEEFGDKVEDLGVWYDNAILTIAVPDYMDADSIADLASVADQVNGEIIGIEPGAGLTRVTKDEAIPGYKLGDAFKLVTSSTTAMLTALDKAIAEKEPIVVTLWRPHWAYSAYPIRDLKDPEGLMGGAEEIHVIGRKGFSDDHKEVADALANFKLDDEQLASLEAEIFGDDPSNPDIEGGVSRWIKDNQDFVDGMFSSKADS